MKLLQIILVMLAWSGAAIAGPYDGIFRPDGDWAKDWDCDTVGMGGGAYSFSGNQYRGIESLCILNKPTPVRGMDATLFDADCTAEGDSYSYRIMVMKTDVGIAVILPGGDVTFLRRCE